jgi:hypothetical protein
MVMGTAVVVAAAVLLADRVSTPAELKEAVTPVGRPDATRVTVPVNPPCLVIVMLLVPLAP